MRSSRTLRQPPHCCALRTLSSIQSFFNAMSVLCDVGAHSHVSISIPIRADVLVHIRCLSSESRQKQHQHRNALADGITDPSTSTKTPFTHQPTTKSPSSVASDPLSVDLMLHSLIDAHSAYGSLLRTPRAAPLLVRENVAAWHHEL